MVSLLKSHPHLPIFLLLLITILIISSQAHAATTTTDTIPNTGVKCDTCPCVECQQPPPVVVPSPPPPSPPPPAPILCPPPPPKLPSCPPPPQQPTYTSPVNVPAPPKYIYITGGSSNVYATDPYYSGQTKASVGRLSAGFLLGLTLLNLFWW